jgi:hypothetical protein
MCLYPINGPRRHSRDPNNIFALCLHCILCHSGLTVGEPPFAVVKDETHVPLLNGQEPSSLSSSHTSGVWAPKPLGEQPKLPIIIMMVVQFLDNLTFSIIIPSLFSFINSVRY